MRWGNQFQTNIEKWQNNGQKKYGVGGFSKILRNFQSGSWQMLTFDYKVGGWGEKMPKTCLRNILMVPKSEGMKNPILRSASPAHRA